MGRAVFEAALLLAIDGLAIERSEAIPVSRTLLRATFQDLLLDDASRNYANWRPHECPPGGTFSLRTRASVRRRRMAIWYSPSVLTWGWDMNWDYVAHFRAHSIEAGAEHGIHDDDV